MSPNPHSRLSSRQQQALEALLKFQQEHQRPPTRAELGGLLGVSAQTADFHLRALERKGVLRLSRQSRGIDLLPAASEMASAADASGGLGAKPAASGAGAGASERSLASTTSNAVPILGRVAAGSPLMALENHDGSLPLPEGCAANFALRVEGESMIEAGILDGDLVLIEQGPEARTGDIVVAMIGEGETSEATVKRYLPQRGRVVLRPANATMEDIVVRRGEPLSIAGRVVGVIRIWG